MIWRDELAAEARLPCLHKDACLGPTQVTDARNISARCAPHYQGPLCAACAARSYRVTGTYECAACNTSSASSAAVLSLVVLILIGVIAAVVGLTLADGGQAAPVDMVMLKILMNHFVIVSAAASFPLRWPAFIQAMMTVMSVSSGSAGEVGMASIDCLVSAASGWRPVHVWGLAMAIVPPAALTIVFLVLELISRVRRKPMSVTFQVTALVVLILGHPSLCKSAFDMMSCRFVGGQPFLEADLNMRCGSNEHLMWVCTLGVPVLIIYGAGVPTYYFFRMRRLRAAGTLE